MNSNKKHCQKCGAEIADAKTKKCAECGANITTPIFKKWWFWVIVVVGIVIIGSAIGTDTGTDTDAKETTSNAGAVTTTNIDNKDNSKSDVTTYEVVDLRKMIDDLNQNALKAEKEYNNKYVQITGKIANFDSSGSYISIEPVNADEWDFDTVMCYIKKDSQLEFLMEKSVGDTVSIKGKVISVGEVLGYSLNIDEIS